MMTGLGNELVSIVRPSGYPTPCKTSILWGDEVINVPKFEKMYSLACELDADMVIFALYAATMTA
jgi:hypothetical protein